MNCCWASILLLLLVVAGCSRSAPDSSTARPNVLFVVWDTVRADRLSLYGHEKPTTPFLEQWARQARVYDDCISAASSTIPSHASMFTGLLPTEHGATESHQRLDDRFDTLAERFRDSGYRTYLFSANPRVSSQFNFTQGFDVTEHPWSSVHKEEARRIVREKVDPRDRSSELPDKLRRGRKLQKWDIKASGDLAQRGLEAWLGVSDPQKPWFAFLNYMEAHRPFIPSYENRTRIMTPEQVVRSYEVDRSWVKMWSYTFGLVEYTSEELDVMAATYDAALVDLDDLFRKLITSLEAAGRLENTIIVLTSDHGEHLGEHHMLDHQYSVYQGLLHVPLVLHYPPLVQPGREDRPVTNGDLSPTLLTMALPATRESGSHRNLLQPSGQSMRLAEYPAPFAAPFESVRRAVPGFDPTPYQRRLRALFEGRYKLIWGSDGRHALYDIVATPDETRDILSDNPELSSRLLARLDHVVAGLAAHQSSEKGEEPSEEVRERLRVLGYDSQEPGD